MKLTNKMRLPASIVAAVSNDTYTKGDADFSVTELLSPPQLARLKKDHYHELEEDVADRMWSLLGQATHTIIERAGLQEDVLTEVTLTTHVLGKKIKGTVDNVTLSLSELNDYKITTVWKVGDGKVPPEWVQQTNIYRYMLKKEKGIEVNSIAVIAILRDWSRNEANKRAGYPEVQVVRVEIPIWTEAQCLAFLEARVRLHSEPVPQSCDDNDVWAKPAKYAVMKKGRQSAVKLFDWLPDAEDFSRTISGSWVETRPGVATRCQTWCPVSEFCEQWRNDPRRVERVDAMEGFFQ